MKSRGENTEQEINKVIIHHDMMLKEIQNQRENAPKFDASAAEEILRSRGYDLPQKKRTTVSLAKRRAVVIRPWNEVFAEADRFVSGECDIKSIFTEEELQQNTEAIHLMNIEFNQIHRLDKVDVAIGALAGMVGSAVDTLMVGIPQKTSEGLKAGPLSNYIRDYFDRKFPEKKCRNLLIRRRVKFRLMLRTIVIQQFVSKGCPPTITDCCSLDMIRY